MKRAGEKIIELKPDADGTYKAVGEVYREPKKQRERIESRATPATVRRKPVAPVQNEKIQSALEGMQAGLAIFRELKRLLR